LRPSITASLPLSVGFLIVNFQDHKKYSTKTQIFKVQNEQKKDKKMAKNGVRIIYLPRAWSISNK